MEKELPPITQKKSIDEFQANKTEEETTQTTKVNPNFCQAKKLSCDDEEKIKSFADELSQKLSLNIATSEVVEKFTDASENHNKMYATKKRGILKSSTKEKKTTPAVLEKEIQNRKPRYIDGLAVLPVHFKEFFSKVPKPKEAEIKNGLPSWNNGSLDAKLTFIPSPAYGFICSRGRIGEKLWKSLEGGEFVNYDPNGYEISIPYEPLHDQHLKKFFEIPYNVINLKKLGLVTENEEAKCTLKEYNSYRKYLYKIYSETLRKAMAAKRDDDEDEMLVKKALSSIKKEIEKQLRRETVSKRFKAAQTVREEIQHEKEKRCMDRLARIQEVQKEKERHKEESIHKAEERHAEFKNRIQQRVIVAAEIEHKRKIDALLQRQADDKQFKLSNEQDRLKKKKDKEKKIQERWDQKIRNQNFSIMRECTLRDKRALDLKNKAKKRLKKNFMQQKSREEQLAKLKEEQKIERQKAYQRRIQEKYQAIPVAQKVPYHIFLEPRKIPDSVDLLVERFRRSQGFSEIVETHFSTDKKVPPDVKDIIDGLMDEAIKKNIRKEVTDFVKKLIKDAKNMYKYQEEEWRAKKGSFLHGRRPSLSGELSCIPSEQIKRRVEGSFLFTPDESSKKEVDRLGEDINLERVVSFGKVETVGQVDVSNQLLKCVQEREPTPVPSGFNSPDVDSTQEESLGSYGFPVSRHLPQKSQLLALLEYMSKSILNSLESRIISYFYESCDVATFREEGDIEAKETSIVDYVTATLVNVCETLDEIDEDECLYEVVRYITKNILYF